MTFHGAYHGHSNGALSLMGNVGAKSTLANLAPGAHFFPYPYSYVRPWSHNLTYQILSVEFLGLAELARKENHSPWIDETLVFLCLCVRVRVVVALWNTTPNNHCPDWVNIALSIWSWREGRTSNEQSLHWACPRWWRKWNFKAWRFVQRDLDCFNIHKLSLLKQYKEKVE